MVWPSTAPLPGETGEWGACGGAVVQLDYDEEMEPLLGMYGSVEAEFEVQGTIQEGGIDGLLQELILGSTFWANVHLTDGSSVRCNQTQPTSQFVLNLNHVWVDPQDVGSMPRPRGRLVVRTGIVSHPDSHQSVWPRCTFLLTSARHRPKLTSEKTSPARPWAHTHMSRVVVIEKPQEAQKAETLWDMKAAKDAGEDNTLGETPDKISTLRWAPQSC